MKIQKSFSLLLTCFAFAAGLSAQASVNTPVCMSKSPAPFSDCAAIFYKGQMLVNDYSPDGKCKLENNMKGRLTLSTVHLSPIGATPTKNIGFMVSIIDNETGTSWLFSDKILREVELEDILMQCRNGDKIQFLTVDKTISLPHNEIEVVWGC